MKSLTEYVLDNKFIVLLLGLYLLDPFSLGHYFGYIIVLTVIFQKSNLLKYFDTTSLLIFLFSLIYALFYSFDTVNGVQYIAIYTLFPVAFYLLGRRIGWELNSKSMSFFLCASAFIFSLSALISVLLNIYEGGFVQFERSIPMFWNENIVSATQMGSFFTLNMCIPAILISRSENLNWVTKIILSIIFVVSLLCCLRLGSRTQLAILVITSIISAIYVVQKQGYRKNITLFIIMTIGIGMVIRYGSFDLNSDLFTAFASRIEDSNNAVSNAGGRSERWVKSTEYLFSHPFGWELEDFGFSHNLWFDASRVGGVITFIVLILVFIKAIRKLIFKLRDKTIYLPLRVHFLAYAVGFFLIFMVEPIIEGAYSLFVFYFLYYGIICTKREDQDQLEAT